jgi:20S proteasome subunit beta 2
MALACRSLRDVLYDSGGSVGANLIIGGVDEETGLPQIRAIHPGGSMDTLPYAALGSGGLAAMAVIESRYRNNINLHEGIQIVKQAILSGIQNDMGSGSQVDLCIITTAESSKEPGNGSDKIKVVTNYTRAAVPEEKIPRGEVNPEAGETNMKKASELRNSSAGVDGFGNHPYSVRSKRLVVRSRQVAEEQRLKKWEEFLGLQ